MSDTVRTLANLDFVGGNIGLDFANTINSRMAAEYDYITTYEDLVAWTARAEAVHGNAGHHVGAGSRIDPDASTRELRRARRLRDAIYATFSAIAGGATPPPDEARRVLRAYGSAIARASLADANVVPPAEVAPPTLSWPVPAADGRVIDPIAYAAGGLLTMRHRPLIKECPGCGWLFVDQSRNGSRRWCDMQTCGSRDKMRRYYRSRRLTEIEVD